MYVIIRRLAELNDKWAPLRDIKNWAIVGAALAVLSVIICLLLCCSIKRQRRIQVGPSHFNKNYVFEL